ncbi:MAG: hypothetical protein J1F23_08970 [Oscillospiraceae bacterium]|nr:hypothetical protein [Oscillospiraceae bacterium]
MRKALDMHNKTHDILTALCLALCLCALLPHLLTSDTGSTAYPLEQDPAYYNAYVQQFDAFMKGQLYLDVTPSQELQNLENPYDWQQRIDGDIGFYLWDRALYNGHYYSYFGIAPIITVFYPSYLLTGSIPSPSVTCAVLAVMGMISVCFALIELLKYFEIKPPFYLFLLSLFAVELGSLLPMLMSSADMYYIAATSAVAYFALFLALLFGGMNRKRGVPRNICFALCSISFVLVVMSRPGVALLGLIIIPALINYFFSKKTALKSKIVSLICFAVPLIIGAAAVCAYNYFRFDSILEFGAKYQLTVYDVSKYTFSMSLIFPCIFHYFLQPPVITDTFPFIDLKFVNLQMHTTPYLYNTSTLGAFSFASNWGILLFPTMLAKSKKSREQKFTYLLAFLSVFVLAYVNTCMGGINIRYFADFALVMILFSSLILLELPSFFEHREHTFKIIIKTVVSILFILSAVLGFLLIFENERNYILDALSQIQ